MHTTEEYIRLLTQYKKQNAERYGIKSIGIFGSVARGEQHPGSDVDVVVDMDSSDYFALCNIRTDLESLFASKVDLVQRHKYLRPLFRKNIERDAIMA